jgi:predicted DNA-binding transcriptional regulator YafY
MKRPPHRQKRTDQSDSALVPADLPGRAGRSSSLEAVKKSLRFLDVLAPNVKRTSRDLLVALGCIESEARDPAQSDAERAAKIAADKAALRAAQRQLGVLVELGLAEASEPRPGLPTTYSLADKAARMGLARHVTVQEWAVLQMAASQFHRLLPLDLQEALRAALQRLAPGVEGSVEHQRAVAWSRKTGFVPNALVLERPNMPPGVMSTCFEALWNDLPLRFHYTKPDGEESTRDVQALALVQQASSHLLVARELNTDEVKHFALHRMQDVRISSELPLNYPADFDLQRDALQGKFGFGDGSAVRVVFEIDADSGAHLYETPLSTDQQVEKLDKDWLRIRATVPDNLWFWSWLRGFGSRARLVEPADRVRHLLRHPKARPK